MRAFNPQTRMDIQPIPTSYNGIRFRSRLEARWAVFFDYLGYEYEYEPEGIMLNGVKYLVDFWLPKVGMFAEVKPTWALSFEKEKVRLLVDYTHRPCLFLVGPPAVKPYSSFEPPSDFGPDEDSYLLDPHLYRTEERFYYSPLEYEMPYPYEEYLEAVKAAAGARFERAGWVQR